jgi:hypothetical protein
MQTPRILAPYFLDDFSPPIERHYNPFIIFHESGGEARGRNFQSIINKTQCINKEGTSLPWVHWHRVSEHSVIPVYNSIICMSDGPGRVVCVTVVSIQYFSFGSRGETMG